GEIDLRPLRVAECLQAPERSTAARRTRRGRVASSSGSRGGTGRREEDQGEDSNAFHCKPPGGGDRTLIRGQGLLWGPAGVAELANALGLGPSGADAPWRFESSRPHCRRKAGRLRAR